MKKGIIKFFTIFAILFTLLPLKVNALTFKVEKSVDTIKPAGQVIVYIKATGVDVSDSIQLYNIHLSYDNSKLDLVSSSSDIASISATNPIDIKNEKGTISSDVTIATIVFNAKANAKAGDANLTLSSDDCTTISGNKITAINTSSMVKVASLSSDATLSSLKIPNATLSPKFDKNTTEYTTSIRDITELTVNASTTDSNAKVMISDNYKSLVKGENEIKVAVTAEDGKTTKTYIIKVTLTLTPTDEELLKANAALSKLQIENYPIEFDSTLKKYSITVPYDTKKVNIIAEAENPNASIEMEGTTNLKVGRNTIKVVVTSEDTQNKEVYVLTITREEEEKEIVQTCPDTTSSKEWIIFSISMFFTFTLGIVLGYFLCKKEILNKLFKKKDKIDPKKEEELSNTIEVKSTKEKKKTKNKIEDDFEENK